MSDFLCDIYGFLSPIFDFVNSILAIIGLDIDFAALFGCEVAE